MKVNVNEETVTVELSKQEAFELKEALGEMIDCINMGTFKDIDEIDGLGDIEDFHWELYKLFKGVG